MPVGAQAWGWAPTAGGLPVWLDAACTASGLALAVTTEATLVRDAVRRGRPAVVIIDAASADSVRAGGPAELLVRALKADAFTAVVPTLVVAESRVEDWLALGADDVLDPTGSTLGRARLAAALRRSTRDLSAQPTTRLPGAGAIDAQISARIADGAGFAACYADLDHFKEFNDRYGFREGDRVIRMLGRMLHDVAVGVGGPGAFAGHIGGDDFMLVLPLAHAAEVCELAIEVFDALAPFQYTEADRRAGYYFGKDRRGQLHRVPLMTLSIGVATTERRKLRDAAEVSRLATEMKSFAKARPGSNYAVDRRGDDDPTAPTTPGPGVAPTPRLL